MKHKKVKMSKLLDIRGIGRAKRETHGTLSVNLQCMGLSSPLILGCGVYICDPFFLCRILFSDPLLHICIWPLHDLICKRL